MKKRFKHDKKFHEVYTNFMQDMISKGHVELQSLVHSSPCVKHTHAMRETHPSKPRKLRVAFDCSADWHGISVNKSLMSDPDPTR